MNLGESLEDYLEAVLILEDHKKIRSTDVANRLKVSLPSVNKAMRSLKEKGYILQESYGGISLTLSGKEIATKVYERHMCIYNFLCNVLEVPVEIADQDACHIEHVISDITFTKLKNYNK